jgi:hypothetical protein
MKGQRHTELPRFIVGVLATAGASVANGATVQITFGNNVVSSATGTTQFTSDLTGDDTFDVFPAWSAHPAGLGTAQVGRSGVKLASARYVGSMGSSTVKVGLNLYKGAGQGGVSKRGLILLSFTDSDVNRGQETTGWLDVTASASSGAGAFARVTLHRLIFDDESTTAPTGLTTSSTGIPEWQVSAVPEPGSNLALLALGAGGLTLRRRLKRAA